MATTVDLTAKADIKIKHKVGYTGHMLITIYENGVILDITNHDLAYKAGDLITKSVSNGITKVDATNGKIRLSFTDQDGISITQKTLLYHELKITIAGEDFPLFDGVLQLETTTFPLI